jgi:hypothetical protein
VQYVAIGHPTLASVETAYLHRACEDGFLRLLDP